MVEARDDEAVTDTPGGSKVGRRMFLVIGTVSLLIGLWQCYTTTRLVRHGITATGHVVGRGPVGSSSGAHPDVEFRTASGALVRYNQNGMGERPIGSPIRVLYDPVDPAGTAVADSFWQLWTLTLLPIWVGGCFVGLILMGAEVEVRGPFGTRLKR